MIPSENKSSKIKRAEAESAEPLLRIEQLFWQPGTSPRPILNDVSAQIKKHQFCALIGPNGAGKSSLIKAILGFIRPQRGDIFLGEKNLRQLSRLQMARLMAYLPQNSETQLRLPVGELLMMARHCWIPPFARPGKKDHEAVAEAVRRCQCEALLEQDFSTLSGGEKQRVLCARAMAQESDFILLDEPVSNLDIRYEESILLSLKNLCKERGTGIVCVIHDINLAARFADTFLLMKEGRIFAAGEQAEVLSAPLLSRLYDWPLEELSDKAGRRYFFSGQP